MRAAGLPCNGPPCDEHGVGWRCNPRTLQAVGQGAAHEAPGGADEVPAGTMVGLGIAVVVVGDGVRAACPLATNRKVYTLFLLIVTLHNPLVAWSGAAGRGRVILHTCPRTWMWRHAWEAARHTTALVWVLVPASRSSGRQRCACCDVLRRDVTCCAVRRRGGDYVAV